MKNIKMLLKVCAFMLFTAVIVTSCNKTKDPYASYTPEREAGLISDWLAAMVTKDKNIDTTSTGLYYIVEKEGTGETVKTGDTLTVKYTGMYLDGTVFDASAYHGDGTMTYIQKGAESRLVPGWEEGIEVMKKGGKAAFLIPSAKAYGALVTVQYLPILR